MVYGTRMAREKQFINEALVTSKRFGPPTHTQAPKSTPTPEPDAAEAPSAPPAAAETTPDAPPDPADSAATHVASSPEAERAPAPAPAEPVTALHRREDDHLRAELMQEEVAEFGRRRQELRNQLHRDVSALEHGLADTEARLDFLKRLQRTLEQVQVQDTTPLTATEFRQARQELEQIRLELLKLERDKLEATPATSAPGLEIHSLTFGQLTRLGLGLTWPLILALLLAAAAVTVALLTVF